MVKGIEIIINNGVFQSLRTLIHNKENTAYINEKKYSISDEQINKILSILATWEYEYGKNYNIDSEEFTVIVYSNNDKTTYHGKGKYPINYDEFKNILGDIIYE